MYDNGFKYDPNLLEEYMKAGRKERALAFGRMLVSIKELFTRKTDEPAISTPVRPDAAGAC